MSTENKAKTFQLKCPNCGNPDLAYSADHEALHCGHCGYNRELPKDNDNIREHPLHLSASLIDTQARLQIEQQVFHCESCGSEISAPQDQVRIECPFCGSEKINENATETRVIKPAGVLPFSIAQKEALQSYKSWLTRGWFTPNGLGRHARLEKMHGVYLPFWTFDAYTRSSWTAEAGYYYFENKRVRDANGNVRTVQVRKIRWRPARGRHEHAFDDVLVSASHGLEQTLCNKIQPFKLPELVNYDPHYLLGWDTELYQKDLKEGFRTADRMMDEALYQACAREVPGDTFRFLRIDTHKEGLTFKHILLPVWIANYRYKSKLFQFAVNGQTGHVAGKKPKSPWKIALAVIGGIILALLIYFLAEYGQRVNM